MNMQNTNANAPAGLKTDLNLCADQAANLLCFDGGVNESPMPTATSTYPITDIKVG